MGGGGGGGGGGGYFTVKKSGKEFKYACLERGSCLSGVGKLP